MVLYIVKLVISAALIVVISEVGKRLPTLSGLIASLPLVSLLAIIWMAVELPTDERSAKIADHALGTFWFVLPSLTFFIALPLLLKYQVNFVLSYIIALVVMIGSYYLMAILLKQFGVPL